MCTSNRDDNQLENTVKQSRLKHLGELHKEWTEAGVSASRVTMLRHLQEKGHQATYEICGSHESKSDAIDQSSLNRMADMLAQLIEVLREKGGE